MSTVIEKITLYDFFGYLIPGLTFEVLLCAIYLMSLDSEAALQTVTQLSAIGGSLYIVFFLLGYVLGLLLSEISARFFGMRCMRRKLCAKVASRVGLSAAVIRKALINSGLVEETDENAQESAGVEMLLDRYSQLMYSDIQTDSNYKRIHEYYSFATMCKNLSAAFALSTVLTPLIMTGCDTCRIVEMVAAQLFAALIFFIRYRRFYRKKQVYTVQWFVAKNQKQKIKTTKKGQN